MVPYMVICIHDVNGGLVMMIMIVKLELGLRQGYYRYDYKTDHRKPPQTTPNQHKPPQMTTNDHKSPQTTTNHHQNLGRLVVKTLETRQTTANHCKPLQTTARIWDDDYSSAGKKQIVCLRYGYFKVAKPCMWSTMLSRIHIVPNPAYLRRFGGSLR